ncbi:MAG: SpoIIE family protein phosphatase, partial [Bdellovibrionales bacterium]
RGLAERLSARHIEGSVESSQTQEQFFSSIAEFFCQLARLHKRIVLHIDDVQWLDQASLATLMQIQERIKSSPIVLLMTARNDGASLEALNKFIGMWPIGNGARRLTLKPLGVEAMDEIIKVQLGGSGLRPQLVERLAAKASGNPFAISQYIYAMVDARVLQRSGAQWVVDESRLDQLIVSTNIIDIVLARAKGLSPTTLEVLQAAAIIGTKFDEALVGQVIQTPAVVSTALNDATRANLIESLGHGLYAFVHDRILEALLKDLSSSQISGLHQRVAEIMDARPEAHDLYALASHYAHGEHAKIPLRTYQTCFDAGLQALENFANDDAAEFLEVAYSVKQTHLQKLPPPNVLELHQALGMAYWRKGVGQRAIGHCTRVLELTSDPLLQAQVRAMMTNIYFNENQGSQGWVESERGLATMGTSFPKSRFLAHLMNLVHWLRYTIYRRLGLGYGQATGLELKRRCVMLSLYGPSTFASFVGLRYEITAQLVPRMLFQLHRVGDRIESVPGFAFYAFWLGFHGARAACVKMAEHAIEIAQNRADNQMLATARYYSGFGIHWSGQPQLAEQFQKQSLMAYGKWMAPRSYISTANDLAGNNLLIRGHARDALAIVELCQKKAQSTKNQSAIAVSQALALGVHAVLGNEAEIEKLLSGLKDIYGKIAEDSLDWCWYLAHLLLYHLECDRSIDDLDGWIARYNRLRVDPRRAPLFFKTMYLYAAYAALRAYVHADAANVRTARARFRECHRRFQQCCGQMPHWLCHDWIMRAECALHEGRLTTAVAYINRAEKLAEESDSPWGLFLAYRNQARIARAKNRLDDIVSYARRAEMLAAEHRWKQRQASLRKEFQADFARVKVTEHHQVNRASGADVSSIRRQLDALLAISRVSARHNGNLKEMVSETLNELVRVFSADRAFLLLLKADGSLDHYGRSSGGETLSQLSGYSSTVVDKVISERRSMIVASTGEGALIGSMSAVAHDLRSIIAAPLVCNQRLIGALYLDSRMSNNLFHKDDIRLLEGVCDHVAVFVDAAHISNKLQALLDISLASGVVLDPEAQARIALDEVISILGAQRAFLFQVDEVSHQLKPWFGRDSHKQDLTEIKGYSSTVVTRAHREQQPVLVTGSAEGELLGSRSAVIHDLRSIMAAPLVNKGHQLGVLYLDSQVVKGGFRPDDTKVLMSISNMISIAFITSKITKLEIERRRLESNLEVTGSVQSLLLPQQSVSVQDQLGVAGYCQSAEQSGGDWWWHERLPNGNHLVALGDITGHGAGPAMVAAMVAGIFRTVVPQLTQLENNLSELGPLLNEKLLDICQGNYWMTMAVAEINSVTGKTSLWTAASPDPLILRAGREVEVVPGYGSFLGSSKDFDVGYTELTLSRGDILLIPSDGVYEMRTRKDRQLGQRVSMKILQEVGTHGNIEDVRDAFINRINKERGSTPLADDLTFVVVKRL